MADRYGILGQMEVTTYDRDGDWFPTTLLYEVPAPAKTEVGPGGTPVEVSPKAASIIINTLVTGIVVCCTSANYNLFSIGLTSAAGVKTFLFRLNIVSVGDTQVLSLGLTLSPGDKIYATAAIATIATSFTCLGIETTSRGGPN